MALISFIILTLKGYSRMPTLDANLIKAVSEIHITERIVMTFIFSFIYFSLFVMIPFGYFYAEEAVLEHYTGSKEFSKNKCFKSIKNTTIFTLCLLIIFFVVFLTFFNKDTKLEDKNFKLIFNDTFNISYSVFNIFGFILFCYYCSYGLGYLPFSILISNKSNESKHQDYKLSEGEIKDKIDFLKSKQKRKGKLNLQELQKLELLEEREK